MNKPALYIGLMSGTSLDGVDAALCSVDENSCQLIASVEYPFPDALKRDILDAIENDISLKKIGELDQRLGYLFAGAVKSVLDQSKTESCNVVAVGSHGQTLWHQPEGEYPFSIQLGDPNVIAVQTGIPVVADFRRKDMALGGEGAPFAPAFHQFLFGSHKRKVAVVNIGGMANISIIGASLTGYDTGPGNVLMDAWIERVQGEKFDRDGAWAASGSVNGELLERMLSDNYFAEDAPKSTGREKFNMHWLLQQLGNTTLREEDVAATLLELTARSIVDELQKFDRNLLLLCGGGAKNVALVKRIEVLLPECEVALTDSNGVDGDSMEAMAFAWLAHKRVHREKVELCSVTGARENAILGGLYE